MRKNDSKVAETQTCSMVTDGFTPLSSGFNTKNNSKHVIFHFQPEKEKSSKKEWSFDLVFGSMKHSILCAS